MGAQKVVRQACQGHYQRPLQGNEMIRIKLGRCREIPFGQAGDTLVGGRIYVHGGICEQNLAARAYSCCLLRPLVRLPILKISARSKGSVLAFLTILQDERRFLNC